MFKPVSLHEVRTELRRLKDAENKVRQSRLEAQYTTQSLLRPQAWKKYDQDLQKLRERRSRFNGVVFALGLTREQVRELRKEIRASLDRAIDS